MMLGWRTPDRNDPGHGLLEHWCALLAVSYIFLNLLDSARRGQGQSGPGAEM